MTAQFFLPWRPAFDANAKMIPGALLWFTLFDTDTPINIFTTSGLTVEQANPVVANSVGRFPNVYYDDSIDVRVRLYDADAEVGVDTPIEEFNPYLAGFEDNALRADLAAASGATLVGGVPRYAATRSAMAALPTTRPVLLSESGREGLFVWSASNLSAEVTLDTQQGIYVAPASATTGASGAWVRKYSGPIDIRWFGAVSGTGVGDQQAAISGALTVAAGRQVHIPVGQWRIDSGITQTVPANLIGDGCGAGPGAVINSNCSQILANFLSGDMLKVTSLYASTIRGIQFNSNVGTRSGGAAIHLSGDTLSSTGSNSVIEQCAFNGQYENIRLTRYVQARIEQTYHQTWATWAIVNSTTGGHEPGGGYISHNYFFGDTASGTTQSGVINSLAGYLWLHDNLILGGQVGIRLNVSEHDLGFPSFHKNSIEEQDVYGVQVAGANSKTVSMLKITDNEFSTIARANYQGCIQFDSGTYTLENADIDGNIFRCSSANANFRYVNFQNGSRVRVVNNTISHLSGNGLAVFIGGGTLASGEIIHNSVNIVSGTIPKYSGVSMLRVEDNDGTTFANLPSVANGSVIYCTDGTFANPVAGGGTGCFAKRLNGVWRGD